MKRILSIFMAVLMICLLSVAVFAEGEAADINENVDASDAVVTEESTEEQPAPEAPNVFSRMWEYVTENKATVFEVGFSTLILALLWIIKKLQGKVKNELTLTNTNSAFVSESQNAMVAVMNTLIDGYNKFKQDNDNNKAAEERRDKQIAALTVAVMANLEILSRVYPNSKNLPQGVKDVVNMTYANAMTAINDDAQLSALVTASKDLLAAGTENIASDEESEVSV